ncbi:hypothetical protein [Methylobacterium oxalidis]|uniref:Uncharacterized protein n=1 Tax=Methylobacterium oxalidis TaxID=944322 RepID=A0A512J9K9_9HYPH|nr:hypothetical protein [Methylobacterium oxalidis]GEP06646.1 hypothetical protein MOX02_46840 [Methylobacterium oxalidis]GJE35377.1 hypothetical protein LDDCCGHA_5595 [Methylobacterium oxalidis]GLS66260.1 hypothetical protein GCM10007888_46420 [Methylobacterium oxalidis]
MSLSLYERLSAIARAESFAFEFTLAADTLRQKGRKEVAWALLKEAQRHTAEAERLRVAAADGEIHIRRRPPVA